MILHTEHMTLHTEHPLEIHPDAAPYLHPVGWSGAHSRVSVNLEAPAYVTVSHNMYKALVLSVTVNNTVVTSTVVA